MKYILLGILTIAINFAWMAVLIWFIVWVLRSLGVLS